MVTKQDWIEASVYWLVKEEGETETQARSAATWAANTFQKQHGDDAQIWPSPRLEGVASLQAVYQPEWRLAQEANDEAAQMDDDRSMEAA